jgi:hypothetical protein
MYTIETDLGRFSAETEKEAKKLLRKAMAEQRARDAEECEIRKLARLRAAMAALLVYQQKGLNKAMPRGWRILPVSEPTYCVRKAWRDSSRVYEIETEDGRGTASPYDDITHCLENGAGFCMAVAISKQDCELFAVGVNEGRVYWEPLYGVTMAEFSQPRAGEEAA